MSSQELTSTPLVSPESVAEQVSPLKKLHDFNVAEKSKNLKELATAGIDTVKSFFGRMDIKNTLRSFFKKDITSETSDGTTGALAESGEQNAEPKENYTILRTLNNFESALMQSEISEYYRENNMASINAYLLKAKIPKEKSREATDRILTHLSKKRIDEFKNSVSDKLQDTNLFKEEFAKFWAWRIANPPKEKPLLVRTDSGIKIKSDQFASEAAIEKFMSNHLSTLPDSFFDSLQDESGSKKMNPQELPINIKTTTDIEADITHALAEDTQPINTIVSKTNPEQLAYDIEKQSNGWVDNTMYEKVAPIPAGEALYMLGSINAELKPSSRTLLSEMRHLINSQDADQTFESLTQQVLDTKNDNPPSEKTLRALSNIVNKLNKVAVLSGQE